LYLPNTNEDPVLPHTIFTRGGGAQLLLPSLQGSLTADVAIVGGGFVGVSAALHLAEAGKSVVLVEANEIGWGSAGRNAGHVAPHATKLNDEKLTAVYGPVYGPRLAKVGVGAPDFVQELAARLGIDISAVKGGILTAAHTDAAAEGLKAEAAQLARSGAAVEFLSKEATARVVGSDRYRAALVDRRGIAINPLAWVRGLARAAMLRGARLHEHSRMLSMTRTANGWRVVTGQGEIEAGTLLLCTNAYTDDTWPGLKRTIIPVRSYLGWTKPLPDKVRESMLVGISTMIDTRRVPVAMRLHHDGRLQFGSDVGFGAPQKLDAAAVFRRVVDVLPQLAGVEVEGLWDGWVTRGIADGWRIHELAPGLLTAIGCNGRGVAMGPIMGRELARYVSGTSGDDLIVPLSRPKEIAWYPFHQMLGKAAVAAFRVLDRMEMPKRA
jgi:sarcosine oxidase